MNTFRHMVGTFISAILIVAVLKPQALEGAFSTSVRVVEDSASSVASLNQLVPSQRLAYINAMQPLVRRASTLDGDAITTEEIIDATNKERIALGLVPLRASTDLTASAEAKVKDMIAKEYFEHRSPDGKQVWDLANAAGYDYVIIGENLARGDFVDAQDVVSEWMNSKGHRENMLSPKYQEIGAYAAQGMYEGQEVWFVVQHFGTGRNACPAINGRLLKAIRAMDKDLAERRTRILSEKAELTKPNQIQNDEYKDRVAAFNELVSTYNALIVQSEYNIKQYNSQVAAFNTCLGIYKPVK